MSDVMLRFLFYLIFTGIQTTKIIFEKKVCPGETYWHIAHISTVDLKVI